MLLQGGGASSTVTLTAYVLTALSEVRLRAVDEAAQLKSAIAKAQTYLENKVRLISFELLVGRRRGGCAQSQYFLLKEFVGSKEVNIFLVCTRCLKVTIADNFTLA